MSFFDRIGAFFDSCGEFFAAVENGLAPPIAWAQGHWLTIVLTAEIVGAVWAIKYGRYRRGFCWLLAALATIWIGGSA